MEAWKSAGFLKMIRDSAVMSPLVLGSLETFGSGSIFFVPVFLATLGWGYVILRKHYNLNLNGQYAMDVVSNAAREVKEAAGQAPEGVYSSMLPKMGVIGSAATGASLFNPKLGRFSHIINAQA